MEPDFFKFLPEEIVTIILLKLSVRTIAVSKCVCKSWLKLLKSDGFISSHFAQSAPALALSTPTEDSNRLKLFELEEDELDLDLDLDSREENRLACLDFPRKASIGSSTNGLLFLFDGVRSGYTNFYVCNPITREFLELRRRGFQIFGFGASKLGKHKVVHIDPRCVVDRRFKCHVYTLGTGSWRLVEATDSFEWILSLVGAFLHGNLHWMVKDKDDVDSIERISCFDLETERFSRFTVPPRLENRSIWGLYTLRDSLCFSDSSIYGDGDGVFIWMMKEYGVEKSWTKEYVIDLGLGLVYPPIKVFNNGDVLLWCEKFFYYSKKSRTSREVGGLFGAAEKIELSIFTPSMVSLKCFAPVEKVVSF